MDLKEYRHPTALFVLRPDPVPLQVTIGRPISCQNLRDAIVFAQVVEIDINLEVVSGAPAAQDEVEGFLQALREAAQQVETIDFSQLTDEEREEMKTMIVRMIERLHSAPNAHPPAPDDHAVV